jgi:hypothetical protein
MRVRGKVTNVVPLENALRKTEAALDSVMDNALQELGRLAVDTLRSVAPEGRTKQLSRGIRSRRRGPRGVDVTIHAVAPESGFDYAAITRFGHKVEEIVPTEGRRALLLRFQSGDTGFFDRVRGFHPSGDWVDKAMPTIAMEADVVMRQINSELDLRLFS